MSRQFDAIVIGSGLGGLTAGALYARAGHRVLVIERCFVVAEQALQRVAER
jgi:all-trans-retinol 13,14-reductase